MDKFSQKCQKIIRVIGQAGIANNPGGTPFLVTLGAGLTANTRVNVAHGLNFTPRVFACRAVAVGLDDDNAQPDFLVTKTDATNITLKPSATIAQASTHFLVFIDLETDIGGRYSATV